MQNRTSFLQSNHKIISSKTKMQLPTEELRSNITSFFVVVRDPEVRLDFVQATYDCAVMTLELAS